MIIDALKSAGKISQGVGLINKLSEACALVIIQPDQICKNKELFISIKNTIDSSKKWINYIDDHLKFLLQEANSISSAELKAKEAKEAELAELRDSTEAAAVASVSSELAAAYSADAVAYNNSAIPDTAYAKCLNRLNTDNI